MEQQSTIREERVLDATASLFPLVTQKFPALPDSSQLPVVLVAIMRTVERFKTLSLTGPEKKEVVSRLLSKLIDESDATGAYEPLVLYLVPSIIDTIVSAENGKLSIKTSLKHRFKLIAHAIFPCLQ